MNPNFAEAAKFLQFLKDKNLVDEHGQAVAGASKPEAPAAGRKKAKKNPNTDYNLSM